MNLAASLASSAACCNPALWGKVQDIIDAMGNQ